MLFAYERPLCATSGHSITTHSANQDLPVVLCPTALDGSSETQPSYRLGDLDRIFLVGVSAPAGVTDRNMLDVVPRTFACSDIAQRNHFPALEFEAGYLVKRAPDGCL
jgi:hypothetical protein